MTDIDGEIDKLTHLRKRYMKYLLKYILFVSIGSIILYIVYKTPAGATWLSNNLYILIIFGIAALVLYIIPYFKYQRKLDA
jgi:putative flippase GtrA